MFLVMVMKVLTPPVLFGNIEGWELTSSESENESAEATCLVWEHGGVGVDLK